MTSNDRRRQPRMKSAFPIFLLNMGEDPAIPSSEFLVSGEGLDLSENGLRLRLPAALNAGDVVAFLAEWKHRQFACLAKVVWMSPEQPFVYGVQHESWTSEGHFAAQCLDEESRRKIKDFPFWKELI